MLRRKKKQEMNGQAMLKIPDLTINKIEIEFIEEERDFYDSLFRSSLTRFNTFVRSGTYFTPLH